MKTKQGALQQLCFPLLNLRSGVFFFVASLLLRLEREKKHKGIIGRGRDLRLPATMTRCVARLRPFITANTEHKLFIRQASFFNSFNDISNQFMSPRLLNNFITCLGFSRFTSNRLKNTETGYKRAVFIGFVDKRCEYKIT